MLFSKIMYFNLLGVAVNQFIIKRADIITFNKFLHTILLEMKPSFNPISVTDLISFLHTFHKKSIFCKVVDNAIHYIN